MCTRSPKGHGTRSGAQWPAILSVMALEAENNKEILDVESSLLTWQPGLQAFLSCGQVRT